MDKFIEDLEMSMNKCVDSFNKEISTIRTGRANAAMLDMIKPNYYGFPTPLNQIANITVPEPRQLLLKVFDPTAIPEVVKAITNSTLGLAPVVDGDTVRLTIPALSEERRKEYVKTLGKVSEGARVSIRNVRRNANDAIKKDKSLSEDEQRKKEQEVQKSTDKFIKIVDDAQKAKEKELMTI